MGLKLFRATEFADSQGYHPGDQRRAPHPAWLAAFCAFWIAVPGNWVLWHALSRVPELSPIQAPWLGLRLALLLALACGACILPGCWRRLQRLWCTACLLLSALAGLAVSGLGPPRYGHMALALVLVALLPAGLVWAVRWRRISLRAQAGTALGGTVACALAFLLLALASHSDLASLRAQADWLPRLAVPFGPAGASGWVEQILLPRQP